MAQIFVDLALGREQFIMKNYRQANAYYLGILQELQSLIRETENYHLKKRWIYVKKLVQSEYKRLKEEEAMTTSIKKDNAVVGKKRGFTFVEVPFPDAQKLPKESEIDMWLPEHLRCDDDWASVDLIKPVLPECVCKQESEKTSQLSEKTSYVKWPHKTTRHPSTALHQYPGGIKISRPRPIRTQSTTRVPRISNSGVQRNVRYQSTARNNVPARDRTTIPIRGQTILTSVRDPTTTRDLNTMKRKRIIQGNHTIRSQAGPPKDIKKREEMRKEYEDSLFKELQLGREQVIMRNYRGAEVYYRGLLLRIQVLIKNTENLHLKRRWTYVHQLLMSEYKRVIEEEANRWKVKKDFVPVGKKWDFIFEDISCPNDQELPNDSQVDLWLPEHLRCDDNWSSVDLTKPQPPKYKSYTCEQPSESTTSLNCFSQQKIQNHPSIILHKCLGSTNILRSIENERTSNAQCTSGSHSRSAIIEQSTTTVREQNTTAVRNQSSSSIREQSTDAVGEQTTTAVREQSTSATIEQSTSATIEQSTSTIKEQSTTTVRDESTRSIRQHSTSTIKEQSNSLIREQDTSAIKGQSTRRCLNITQHLKTIIYHILSRGNTTVSCKGTAGEDSATADQSIVRENNINEGQSTMEEESCIRDDCTKRDLTSVSEKSTSLDQSTMTEDSLIRYLSAIGQKSSRLDQCTMTLESHLREQYSKSVQCTMCENSSNFKQSTMRYQSSISDQCSKRDKSTLVNSANFYRSTTHERIFGGKSSITDLRTKRDQKTIGQTSANLDQSIIKEESFVRGQSSIGDLNTNKDQSSIRAQSPIRDQNIARDESTAGAGSTDGDHSAIGDMNIIGNVSTDRDQCPIKDQTFVTGEIITKHQSTIMSQAAPLEGKTKEDEKKTKNETTDLFEDLQMGREQIIMRNYFEADVYYQGALLKVESLIKNTENYHLKRRWIYVKRLLQSERKRLKEEATMNRSRKREDVAVGQKVEFLFVEIPNPDNQPLPKDSEIDRWLPQHLQCDEEWTSGDYEKPLPPERDPDVWEPPPDRPAPSKWSKTSRKPPPCLRRQYGTVVKGQNITNGKMTTKGQINNKGVSTVKRKFRPSNRRTAGKVNEKYRKDEAEFIEIIKRDIVLGNTNIKWDDIANLKKAKRDLKIATILPDKIPYFFVGLRRPSNGILLVGPPGTGKTMLAKAVATEAGGTFFSVTPSTLSGKWRGDSEKLVATLFSVARAKAPSIIFIDEIDALCSKRGASNEHEASRRVKTEILTQMDGFETDVSKRLLIIGATNFPWELDEAMLRRFEKRILVPLPDADAREDLMKLCLRKMVIAKDINLKAIAKRMEGYSCSDVECVCRTAAYTGLREKLVGGDLSAARRLKLKDVDRPITQKDFEGALQKVKKSVCPTTISKYDKWINQFGAR